MNKPSIKTITLRSIINILLVLAFVLIIITGLNFRSLSRQAIESQALAHAELVKAGLTAHMKAGVMGKREYFLSEISKLHQVKSLHIIRGNPVNQQFGNGGQHDHAADEFAMRAFTSKAPVYTIDEFTAEPTIRIVIPYIANQQGALNCLNCHKVPEGTVLGGVDMVIDVTQYRNHGLLVIFGLALLSVLSFFLAYINTSKTIQQHVQEPLEDLIKRAMVAYQHQQSVETDAFQTEEFANVANGFNLLNLEILAHQDLLKRKNEELLALNNEIESTLRETVFTMGVIEEQRSKETSNHTKRVSLYSKLLAERIDLSPYQIDIVTSASALHDVGKLGIPDSVLLKPGALNPEERAIMENHPMIGYSMLKHSQRDILVAAGVIALQHHEKWDGSGYPQKLKGEAIHIYARIVALADVFDALYSPRVYKEAWSIEKVVELIQSESGKHFDPQLVEIFMKEKNQFVKIYQEHPAT